MTTVNDSEAIYDEQEDATERQIPEAEGDVERDEDNDAARY